jgi:hypothetical protein
VLLLPQLGGLEIVVTRREIGAGILPVRIQEQFEQLGREIVVMAHVAASTSGRIELLGAAKQMAQAVEWPPDVALSGGRQVAAEQIEERVQRGILDRQCAVHPGLAGVKAGIQRELPVQGARMQADGHGSRHVIAELVDGSIRIDHREPAEADQRPEQTGQEHVLTRSRRLRPSTTPYRGFSR